VVTTEFVRVGDIRDDEFSPILGCIVMCLSFLLFLSTTIGLSKVMNLLVSGYIGLGLFMICVLLVFACWSIVVFLLDLYFLSKVAPKQAQSKIGFLLGGCLLLLSTMLCLAVIIWLTFASFPLPYIRIRSEILYSILFLILVWRSIVHFKRRGTSFR